MEVVKARDGDTVDQLLWRHRARTGGVTEATLALNPGLAALGETLPAGTAVRLPPASTAPSRRAVVQLWE